MLYAATGGFRPVLLPDLRSCYGMIQKWAKLIENNQKPTVNF